MKRKILFSLVVSAVVCWLTITTATQAQGGCPAQLPAAYNYTVIEALPLASYTAERSSPATPNTFVETVVQFDFDGQERVFVSSSAEVLAPTCIDDYLEITGPLGKQMFDYRSADRSQIVPRDPLATEITPLLEPGANTLRIRLVDAGQYYSNSDLYLVTVTELPPLPTPTLEPATATTATIVPTSAPTVTATVISQSVVNLLPSPTPTKTVVVAHTEPRTLAPAPVWTWPQLLIGLILLMLVSGILWSLWRNRAGNGVIPGELEIYKNGEYVKTLTLADLKKGTITLGAGSMDIWLPGTDIPQKAAKLFTKRVDGQPRTFLISFSADEQVYEERRLHHEDNLYIGEYRLVYKNYAEEEPYLPIGELNHA